MKRSILLAPSLALLLAACPESGVAQTGDQNAPHPHELTVSAAASLTDAFTDIGTAFEDRNGGVTVTFNFGPSDGLAGQINEGAPVDVFASASPTWMDAVA